MTAVPESISVGFISLGCAKNLVDSQTMAGELIAENIILAPTPEAADIVIVNTCAFIEDAREESMEAILSACELKTQGRCRAVLVAGCMPQRYRDQIQDALPDVDGFIGLDELDRVAEVARQLMRGQHGVMAVSPSAERLFEPRMPVVFSSGAYAYVKVAEGCNHRCAFCAIPGIRGKHRSRRIDQVVHEAGQLLASGFRELNIISQDVMSYGRDLNDGTSLVDLLKALDGLTDEPFWIRLLYGYPDAITDDLLGAMGALQHVVPYLDVPIQHSHPDILGAMQRKNTIEGVAQMAARVRAALPGVALRTTCLVGFPGETEAHFEHLLAFIKATRFDHIGAFAYSPEEGTAAYDMDHVPDAAVAQERHDRLMAAQQEIVAAGNTALIETETDFLLESPTEDPDLWRGRSARQAPEVDGITYVLGVPAGTAPGTFARGRYTEVADYDMVAELVS